MNVTSPSVFAAIDVSKRYRRNGPWALRHVSLRLPTGSITALVGPNGAGKSTLIRAAVGFERPTEGQVEIVGIDVWRRRPAALANIGYVPQSVSLYQGLSIADHVRLAGALRQSFDEKLAAARLEALGLQLHRKVGELSGGEQSQVALAIAVGTRAPLLLLDEPISSLDPLARREFLASLVDGAHRDGTTVLLSSHITTDVAELADRIVVLGGGQKLLDDSVADVLASHRVAAPGEVDDAAVVAPFPTATGVVRLLTKTAVGGTPATLEDVVLGYLASSRTNMAEPARAA